MKKTNYLLLSMAALSLSASFSACSDDDVEDGQKGEGTNTSVIGQAVGNFSADEWFPGGKMGTTDNVSSNSYSEQTPAVDEQGLTDAFFQGEMFFDRPFTFSDNSGFRGLGPASVRRGCEDCHPNYGHGKRFDNYVTSIGNGNGYLLVVYHPTGGANSNDGPYISEVTGMPQTQAASPFLPPIDESGVHITWKYATSMKSGLAKAGTNSKGQPCFYFPDGEEFQLQYPDVTIDNSAFNTDPKPTNLAFRLESTIGIGGTGLIDAIPEEDIIAQYKAEAENFKKMGLNVKDYLNPSMWDADKNDMAPTAWYATFTSSGALADGKQPTNRLVPVKNADGTTEYVEKPAVLKRYTYALTRGTLQDGAGANAIWNITNVTRSDRPKLYTTTAWATAMSKNQSVINKIKADKNSPFWADTDAGIAEKVKNLLDPKTNQFDNEWHNFTPEFSDDNYYAFMVWHRGLAVPRARDLDDPKVQEGKKLFMEMGCASCHRPQWKTGSDNYWTSDNIKGRKLPTYPNQTIYPYSDFIQHKLDMINDIHGSWCRTTPLWGRGLSALNTGAEDRLHDCRARNEIEAIMWHAYSNNSHAYFAAKKFYELSKDQRDAVVKFIRSI